MCENVPVGADAQWNSHILGTQPRSKSVCAPSRLLYLTPSHLDLRATASHTSRLSSVNVPEDDDCTCVVSCVLGTVLSTRGAADPIPFHAFRRACRFYSLSLPFAAWWSPHKSDDMGAHAQGPSACAHLGLYGSAQGVLKWEGQRSRRSATRATAAPRPERTNKAFDFVAWKGGVGRCMHE